jgi:hypothetical protein
MKKLLFLTISLLGMMIVLSGMSIASAVPQPWAPKGDEVPGYDHYLGAVINASNDPVMTGVVDNIRVDFWTKDDDVLIVTITIENETNIFDQALPSSIADAISAYASQAGITAEIKTLWDLIKVGLPALAASISTIETKRLTTDDYPYIDDGIAIFDENMTLALVKDQKLAIIAANIPIEAKPPSQAELDAVANMFIDEINALVNSTLAGAGMGITSDPEVNKDVLLVVDGISFQYGDNDYSQGNGVPGYPLVLLGIASFVAVVLLIRKRK